MDYKIILIVGIIVGAIILGSIYGSIKSERALNEDKFAKGEITVFQYCSHLGKDAIDEPDCKQFNLRYGPQ